MHAQYNFDLNDTGIGNYLVIGKPVPPGFSIVDRANKDWQAINFPDTIEVLKYAAGLLSVSGISCYNHIAGLDATGKLLFIVLVFIHPKLMPDSLMTEHFVQDKWGAIFNGDLLWTWKSKTGNLLLQKRTRCEPVNGDMAYLIIAPSNVPIHFSSMALPPF